MLGPWLKHLKIKFTTSTACTVVHSMIVCKSVKMRLQTTRSACTRIPNYSREEADIEHVGGREWGLGILMNFACERVLNRTVS